MGEPFRVEPALPVHAMKTYQILAPRSTHRRPATCEEAGCGAWLNGWQTIVAADSPQAAYIRQDRSRRHAEARREGGLAVFTFEPGQRCFAADQHTVTTGRPARYVERGGDFRGNPRRDHRELTAGDWVDSFANHQIKLAERLERG